MPGNDASRPGGAGVPEQTESRKAVGKAMDLLRTQDRTRKELYERLIRSGFSDHASEYAVDYVSGFGYIDDLRYAQNYVFSQKGKRSRKELRYKLIGKGVEPDTVEAAMEDYAPEEEQETLRLVLKKRLKGRSLSGADIKEKNKITAYLMGKGYSLPMIKRVMQEHQERESGENLR